MKSLTIELLAIRAIVELPDCDRPSADEELDAMTREVLRAFCPRPIASTRPTNVVPFRRTGSR